MSTKALRLDVYPEAERLDVYRKLRLESTEAERLESTETETLLTTVRFLVSGCGSAWNRLFETVLTL